MLRDNSSDPLDNSFIFFSKSGSSIEGITSSGLRYQCIDFRHRYVSKDMSNRVGKGFYENHSEEEYLFERGDDRCDE